MQPYPLKVCFTGKRPQSMPWGGNENDPRCVALKAQLAQAVEQAVQEGYTYFITGMALGVDLWAGEAVVRLKGRYPNLFLEAAIPCETQASSWTQHQQQRYYQLLFCCDKKTMCSRACSKASYLARNRYMVDAAQKVIAVYDGSGGGTGYTIRYARSKGRDVQVIPF